MDRQGEEIMITTWVLVVWFVSGADMPTAPATVSEFFTQERCLEAGKTFVSDATFKDFHFGRVPEARFACVAKGL
jgi:hypothetical protein